MTRLPNDCFALPPGVAWTPVENALALLEERLAPVTDVETAPLAACAGRVLAQDVAARRAHPAADNAAVDGYAFAFPDQPQPGEPAAFRLRAGRSAPGAPFEGALAPGEAVRILTGAPMPEGADTVVLQEDVLDAEDAAAPEAPEGLRFLLPRKRGSNRRRAGENLAVGAPALPAGLRLSPQALAQAASAGLDSLPVHRPLRVALLSTGDELTTPEAALQAGPDKVIDANRPMLAAMLQAAGCAVIDLGVAEDRRETVEAMLTRGAEQADAVIASGGASGGDEDHLAAALADAATRDEGGYHLWRIAMKPGRPLALGTRNGRPVFGLPGNPVAAFVCALIFVLPALRRLAGEPWSPPRPILVPSGFAYAKKPGRREYLRVRLGADGRLEKFRSEGSGLISGLLWSDGLADLAQEAGPLAEGDPVAYLPFTAFGLPPGAVVPRA